MDNSENAGSLEEYKKKRDFKQTSEPTGDEKIDGRMKNQFVIQKHDASNLHYDFRLQIEDVLVSWAVPKGPSTDPSEKRLAIRTEDHPLQYGNFEGVIPEDHYGGGTVLIWDHGTFENIRANKEEDAVDMSESLKEGKIEVELDGKKLKGGYVLIRTSEANGNDQDEKWLLKKMKDEHADARKNPVSTEPRSVISDKTIDEISEKGK